MMNQFLIESMYKEIISSLLKKNWQKLAKTRKAKISDDASFFAPRENGDKRKFGGKKWGDHGIEWKFY